MTELVIRPLAVGEEHLFESLSGPIPATHDYRALAAKGEYRPDWTWVAIREDTVVAKAAWWAGPHDDAPIVLDWLDFTDFDAAVSLLRTAPLRAEYSLKLPSGWRDIPAVASAANARVDAALAAGLKFLVERYQYRWTPDCGLPARPGRLEFRPEPDDGVFLDVFRRMLEGSLDAHARNAVAKSGIEAAAKEDLDFMLWTPGPRDWWRLAYTPAGDLVGLSLPGRNFTSPIIGYVGVVPEHRGHGYAYDLLVEATQLLAAEGVDRIVAATDTTNVPMAAAFAKAGYPIVQHRIDLVP